MTEKDVAKTEEAVEKISEQDKHVLEMALMQRKLALAEAEKATLAHNHIVLQLYMKYNMNVETDAIDEQGAIKRNMTGATK